MPIWLQGDIVFFKKTVILAKDGGRLLIVLSSLVINSTLFGIIGAIIPD